MIEEIHHVQLAMPKGGEFEARFFYQDVLGLSVVAKPEALADRGGAWFENRAVRVHLGIEDPFAPARKAHPAFRVASLIEMRAILDSKDIPYSSDADLPGITRIFVHDPFGNRIELLEERP